MLFTCSVQIFSRLLRFHLYNEANVDERYAYTFFVQVQMSILLGNSQTISNSNYKTKYFMYVHIMCMLV